jgi:predicted aspartyl protease
VDPFSVELRLANQARDNWQTIEARVDATSIYTWIPADILARLGVHPAQKRSFETAKGRRIERNIGFAIVRLNDEEWTTLVVFGEPGSAAVLGSLTLAEFSLDIDATNQRLVPVPALAVGVREQ